MIVDSLDNLKSYFPFKSFDAIVDSIKSVHPETPNGNIQLNNGNYIKVMSDETVLESQIIESHRKEIDIQVLLQGQELIKVYSSDQVTIKTPYNPDIDCQFYENPNEAHSEIVLKEGRFAVFFPQDIHNPLNALAEPIRLKKIVVKLNLEWLNKQ